MIRIRIGLATLIRISIEVKSWIRMRIEANADPQDYVRYLQLTRLGPSLASTASFLATAC
jgi:hypothetical protein